MEKNREGWYTIPVSGGNCRLDAITSELPGVGPCVEACVHTSFEGWDFSLSPEELDKVIQMLSVLKEELSNGTKDIQ